MELLAEDFRDSDAPRDRRALKKVELVERECQRLQDLLENFLRFSKAHRAAARAERPERAGPPGARFLPPESQRAGTEIVDYLSGNLPTVHLDREAFHGALLNLVLNAEQAMPRGGQLVGPHLRHGPTAVALDLIDTGCGMDEDTRAKIFDAFFSTKRGGSGLGLPTTRKIIEGHGGGSICKAKSAAARKSPSSFPSLPGYRPTGEERSVRAAWPPQKYCCTP